MSLRYYANAPATTLNGSVTNVATSIVVTSTAGFPIQYPYTLILDRGTASEEAVSVTAAAGATLTVVRAIDGTTAFPHSSGATVEHGITAQDIREPNSHINTNSGVHGVTGSVVGTSDAQTLSNKDLSSATNTFPSALATLTGAQTLTNKTLALGSNTVSGTLAQFNTAVTDADLASLAGVETLTNKTVNLASNTLTGTTAQFNTALSDGDFATLAGTETLTNKTLTSPTINSPTLTSPTIDTLSGVTGVGRPIYVEKGSDQSIASSATLTDDTALQFSVVANATYEVTIKIRWTGSAGTGGLQYQFVGPASSTGGSGAILTASPFDGLTSLAPNGSFSGGVQDFLATMRFKTGATAGTIKLQWAQQVSNATAAVCKAGSYLSVRRVA